MAIGRIGLLLGAAAVGAVAFFATRGTAKAAPGDPTNMLTVDGKIALGLTAAKINSGESAVLVVYDSGHAASVKAALRKVARLHPGTPFYVATKAFLLSNVPEGTELPFDPDATWGAVVAVQGEGPSVLTKTLWEGKVVAEVLQADIELAAAAVLGALEASAAEPGVLGGMGYGDLFLWQLENALPQA